MANRFPHIIKSNKGTQQPNNCIWFDTETKHRTDMNGKQYHYLWFGWAVYQRRKEGEKWCAPEWFRFTEINQFWEWVIEKTREKTRLYIFAHNGGFDLPVMNAFTQLPERDFILHSAIADAPPLVLTWKNGSRTIKFVDTLNIWRMPLAKIGESIGKRKIAMPLKSASTEEWDVYGKQDTEIIRCVVLAWLSFLRENDLGGFAPTLASQAMNAYRHRFMHTPIFITDRVQALEIDRESYLGGRTECFKMGVFRGDFYYLDFNSMYPSVMFTEEFPNKLLGTYARCTFQELKKWLDTKSVVAQVTINTEEPVYPIVQNGKLVFPVGSFKCVLAGPELSYALENHHIQTLGLCNVYTRAPLFKDFIAFMYTERMKAKADGDEVNTWLYKIMMNSLYGKFGQRGRRYEKEENCDPNDLQVWTELDVETGVITKWRSFGGITQQWIEEGESRESFPAIASYVTSFARLKLWGAINTAGRDNVYYCDTDSLVVNKCGYDLLRDNLSETTLGFLKLEKRLSYLDIRGPKDYTFNENHVVKGIRKNANWLTDTVAEQDYFVGLKGLMREYTLNAPVVYTINKVNVRNYTKGVIADNRDVLPFRLIADENSR